MRKGIIKPDDRGRVSLQGQVDVLYPLYLVKVGPDGTITLTPAVAVPISGGPK